MSPYKPILCLDFDGVLHSYSSGWKGADVIPDPPVEGALEFIKEATEHFNVQIFSSRSHQKGGVQAMKDYLCEHAQQKYATLPYWLDLIIWPTEKPAAFVTLDDRALTFTGEWPSIEDLLAFEPWNKRS